MARRKLHTHTNHHEDVEPCGNGHGHVEEVLTLGVRRNGHNGTNGHADKLVSVNGH